MGGRGANFRSLAGAGGNFQPIDINSTKISKRSLDAIRMQRYEAWAAARQTAKTEKYVKEPSLTKRQTEIYEDIQNGNYRLLDKANNKTFKVIAQKSDYDLYTSVNRVAKSDYGVESDYYTIRGQKRVKSPDNFPDLYKKYRKASKISNELHNRAIKRHLVSL